MLLKLCLEWLISARGLWRKRGSPCGPSLARFPCTYHLSAGNGSGPGCAGRCPEQPVTHAWAAGQFSQRGWPFQGSGPGSIAGLGGHRLPERCEESVLEGSLGSRQQELSLECPPASPNTPRLCPDSGSRHARDSPSEGGSQEETKAKGHPGPRGHCGSTHGVVARGSFQRLRLLWKQSPGHRPIFGGKT